jgi:hypothetical protein
MAPRPEQPDAIDLRPFLAARREQTGAPIPVVLHDQDVLDARLAAGDELPAALDAAKRTVAFTARDSPGAFLEHHARRLAGGDGMNNEEFLARWFAANLSAADWDWLRDQMLRHPNVWDWPALHHLQEQVVVAQTARPTGPRSGSRSSRRRTGRSSNARTGRG